MENLNEVQELKLNDFYHNIRNGALLSLKCQISILNKMLDLGIIDESKKLPNCDETVGDFIKNMLTTFEKFQKELDKQVLNLVK